VDTNDYSLDPGLVGRRVEIRVSQREVRGVALDSGELACLHRRVFARHLELTDPAHQVGLDALRRRRSGGNEREVEVEIRDLAAYDALIPA
jgi:hypothetical protein